MNRTLMFNSFVWIVLKLPEELRAASSNANFVSIIQGLKGERWATVSVHEWTVYVLALRQLQMMRPSVWLH